MVYFTGESQQADANTDSESYSIIYTPTSSCSSFELFPQEFQMAEAATPTDTAQPPPNVDRVQNQPEVPQAISLAASRPCADLPTFLPNVNKSAKAGATHDDLGVKNAGRVQRPWLVYEIPMLMRLRGPGSGMSVFSKVKPEALSENLFQYMGTNRIFHRDSHPRLLSEMSNASFNSMSSIDEDVIDLGKRPLRIGRQNTLVPSDTSTTRRREGLQSFLKQHASPPHQRVTAGGRIVPVVTSPPPMLDYGSLNALAREPSTKSRASRLTGQSSDTNGEAAGVSEHMLPSARSSHYACAPSSMSVTGTQRLAGIQASTQHSQAAPAAQQMWFGGLTYYPDQMPADTQYIRMMEDGSGLYYATGMLFRGWESQDGLKFEEVPYSNRNPSFATGKTVLPQAPGGYRGTHDKHGFVFSSAVDATRSTTEGPAAPQLAKDSSEIEAAFEENNTLLKEDLSQVDQRLAYYHYSLSPTTRGSLVERRKALVVQLDRIRREKQKLPSESNLDRYPRIPEVHFSSASPDSCQRSHQRGASNGISKTIYGCSTKRLSPVAPAFVPMGLKGDSSEHWNIPDTTMSTDTKSLEMGSKQAETTRSSTGPSDNSDPRDPYMRVVHYDDIEYSARYLYHHTEGGKKYCTTVPEFQEAIRQVREQARLYGCVGGSSKDPAYDAEQDIWWAIGSRDPIPVPKPIPDHVANPRPWSWADSVFNYLREGESEPEFPPMDGRDSPRYLKLTVDTVDKEKEANDFSRSYFALRGLLPDVPFRTYVYDINGNKVELESLEDHHSRVSASFKASMASIGLGPVPRLPDPSKMAFPCEGSSIQQQYEKDAKENNPHLTSQSSVKDFAKTPVQAHLRTGQRIPLTPTQRNINTTAEPNIAAKVVTKNPYSNSLASIQSAAHTRSGSYTVDAIKNDTISQIPMTVPKGALAAGSCEPSPISYEQTSENRMQYDSFGRLVNSKPSGAEQRAKNKANAGHTRTNAQYDFSVSNIEAPKASQRQPFKATNFVFPDPNAYPGRIKFTPNTQTKNEWGGDAGPVRRPKVNLPSSVKGFGKHSTNGSSRNAGPRINTMPRGKGSEVKVNEASFDDVTGHRKNSSHGFLRGMLKSHIYSPSKRESKMIAGSDLHAVTALTDQGPNKEHLNHSNRSHHDMSEDNFGINSFSRASLHPDALAAKAPSSLASSTFHARGSTSSHGGWISPSLASDIRWVEVELLQRNACTHLRMELSEDAQHRDTLARLTTEYRERAKRAKQAFANGEYRPSDYHLCLHQMKHEYDEVESRTERAFIDRTMSTRANNSGHGMNYDGGRDSPPPKSGNGGKTQQQGQKQGDSQTKVATTEDFDMQRPDLNNASHNRAVEDFFARIREREAKEMAARRRADAIRGRI